MNKSKRNPTRCKCGSEYKPLRRCKICMQRACPECIIEGECMDCHIMLMKKEEINQYFSEKYTENSLSMSQSRGAKI